MEMYTTATAPHNNVLFYDYFSVSTKITTTLNK